MTQNLWYVRVGGHVNGPFPAPQVRQAHQLGQLVSSDEVSLDAQQWITLVESGILPQDSPPEEDQSDAQGEAWREEREKARLRWLNDADENHVEVAGSTGSDGVASRLRRHEEDTRSLMSARSSRRPAVLAGLIGLLAILLLGVAVWYGQSDETDIQTALINQISQCDKPQQAGIAWAGCDKTGSDLRQAAMANAKLAKAVLERADLSGADLVYADLDGANLRGANLRGAKMRGASLRQADLTGADLSGADLEFAVLNGALMEGTRMDGTRLSQSTMPDGRVCADDSVGQCR